MRDGQSEQKHRAAQHNAEQERLHALHYEAQSIREFLRTHKKRIADACGKGPERKSNVTDNDSAKMATAKGVIQSIRGRPQSMPHARSLWLPKRMAQVPSKASCCR